MNEIAQLWKRPSENGEETNVDDKDAPAETEYSIRRLCWTFKTPKTSKEVEFTVSLYSTTIAPSLDVEDLNETQPLRPALYSKTFTATVDTESTVVSVEIDYSLLKPLFLHIFPKFGGCLSFCFFASTQISPLHCYMRDYEAFCSF